MACRRRSQLLRATLLFIIDDDFPNEREEISKKEPANLKRRRYASPIQRDTVSRTDCLERAAALKLMCLLGWSKVVWRLWGRSSVSQP